MAAGNWTQKPSCRKAMYFPIDASLGGDIGRGASDYLLTYSWGAQDR